MPLTTRTSSSNESDYLIGVRMEVQQRKGTWTTEEDELLVSEINKQMDSFRSGMSESSSKCTKDNILKRIKLDWVQISNGVKSRTGKQCRERWINHLNPELRKCQWSKEEDLKLLKLGENYPSKWAVISRHLSGRSQNQVKIRWNTLNNSSKRGQKRKLSESGENQRELSQPVLQLSQQYTQPNSSEQFVPMLAMSNQHLLQTQNLFRQQALLQYQELQKVQNQNILGNFQLQNFQTMLPKSSLNQTLQSLLLQQQHQQQIVSLLSTNSTRSSNIQNLDTIVEENNKKEEDNVKES